MIDIFQVVVPRYVAYHVQVIAMKKGNPKNITSITDGTRDGVKIALGDVNATAIGKAATKMLERHIVPP
jgi:molybdate transport system substrate-binding protein